MKHIILIEDDLQICEVIQEYFRHQGTEVRAVYDGISALELVRNELPECDLILLDIMLPGADGFTICREIRRKNDIPVIFLTARGREEDIQIGRTTGYALIGVSGGKSGNGNGTAVPRTKKPSSTRKYICPCCGNSFRATKSINVLCMDCNEQYVVVE